MAPCSSLLPRAERPGPRSRGGTVNGVLTRGIRTAGTAIAIVCALVLAGCGSDDQPEATTITVPVTAEADVPAPAPTETPAEPAKEPAGAGERKVTEREVEAAPTAQPPQSQAGPRLEPPPGTYPVVWVRSGAETELRTEPGGGERVAEVDRRTEFGSPSVFGVVEQRDGWVGVTTPKLANNRLGWIKLDQSEVEAGWTRHSVVIDLSERRAALQVSGDTRHSFPVTVGAPGSDTPTGRFAITDTFTDLGSSAYGCCAVALSATQPTLPSGWLGGNRIAIHGTSGPLGIAASHGCVRAADDEVAALIDKVPLGTPVFIRQ